jgi:hypothetical protein
MLGFRQCAACKKELPEELFRGDSLCCRQCARAGAQVYIARGIVAEPKEKWAKELLARLR